MAGIDLSYKFTDWLSVKGQYSIDKSFYEYVNFFPKGYQTPAPSANNNGSKDLYNEDKTQQIMSATAIMQKAFGDFNLGLIVKYQAEKYYALRVSVNRNLLIEFYCHQWPKKSQGYGKQRISLHSVNNLQSSNFRKSKSSNFGNIKSPI